MTNPDQLENDITTTRSSLSSNVDRLTDKVSPSKALGRRMDRMRNAGGSIKEKVMGYADNSDGSVTDAVGAKASSATSAVQDATGAAAGKVADAAGSAPQAVRDRTQGNPLAAGVIAFGVGWLLSALVPASAAEKDATQRLQDNAGALVEPLKESAQEVAGNLQQPLQESAQALKDVASDAATRTADHAKDAANSTADHAKDAASTTVDHAKDAAGDVQAKNPLTD